MALKGVCRYTHNVWPGKWGQPPAVAKSSAKVIEESHESHVCNALFDRDQELPQKIVEPLALRVRFYGFGVMNSIPLTRLHFPDSSGPIPWTRLHRIDFMELIPLIRFDSTRSMPLIRFHGYDSWIPLTDWIHWCDSLIRFVRLIHSIHWFDSLDRFISSLRGFDTSLSLSLSRSAGLCSVLCVCSVCPTSYIYHIPRRLHSHLPAHLPVHPPPHFYIFSTLVTDSFGRTDGHGCVYFCVQLLSHSSLFVLTSHCEYLWKARARHRRIHIYIYIYKRERERERERERKKDRKNEWARDRRGT